MRKGFNQFRNQIGVAVENISLSKTCFACYEGDIKASITVYNGGAFSISVDIAALPHPHLVLAKHINKVLFKYITIYRSDVCLKPQLHWK